MNIYVGVTSALHGSELLASRTGRFTPEEITPIRTV
jgi:hypothetical protein